MQQKHHSKQYHSVIMCRHTENHVVSSPTSSAHTMEHSLPHHGERRHAQAKDQKCLLHPHSRHTPTYKPRTPPTPPPKVVHIYNVRAYIIRCIFRTKHKEARVSPPEKLSLAYRPACAASSPGTLPMARQAAARCLNIRLSSVSCGSHPTLSEVFW